MRYSIIAVSAALFLSACGSGLSDRTLSGAVIGAGGAALIGANLGTGALAGAAVGAVTNASQIDLGSPIW